MYKGKSFLAVIPARGGSKGLPGKNIKPLLGQPLIAWSIESGLKSTYIDKVIVSTDDQEIADISKRYGANVPFIRPSKLASDISKTFDVLKHAIEYHKQESFDYIVLLEPTSPLRESKDIDLSIKSLINSNADSIVGVGKTEDQNPAFLVNMDNDGFISGYENKLMTVKRRQDISNVYFFEGSIYISKISSLLENKTFYHKKTIGYQFPKYKTLEVDDMDDYIMIEAIMKHKGYCNYDDV